MRPTLHALNKLTQMSSPEIITKSTQYADVITLNRPAKLNALSSSMINELSSKITPLLNSTTEKTIFTSSIPRAFCAGADVASLAKLSHEIGLNESAETNSLYFRKQFKLDYDLHTNPKQLVSIWNGVSMGGGLGLTAHGQFRVCTETTLFAMPECKIGHFPDVAMLYFLYNLKSKPLGLFAALTGHRFKAHDCINLNLATHYIHSSKLEGVINELSGSSASQSLEILNKHSSELPNNPAENVEDLDLKIIDKAFNANSVEEILNNLLKVKPENPEFVEKTITLLRELCPLSLKVTFKAFHQSHNQTFKEAWNRDFLLANNFCLNKNFVEGVTALLIEKRPAKWDPQTLEEVSDELVNSYFETPSGFTELI